MKISKSIAPFVTGLLAVCWGCESVVELELPVHSPKLVVNAVLNPDSLMTVDLSASQSAFSNASYRQLEEASVQIFQNGQLLFELQHTANGIYKGPQAAEALQHYELRASAPGFPSVRAQTFIPSAPLISEIQASSAPPRPDWGPGVEASFLLDDRGSIDNYYMIQAYTPAISHIDGKPYNRSVSFSFIAPIEPEFSMEDRYFFSNKLFQGQLLRLLLYLDNPPDQTTYLRLASISPEYYHYVRTLDKQSYRENFMNESIAVANNIENGMGLFAGYNRVVMAIKP
jgi:hypothetical protein